MSQLGQSGAYSSFKRRLRSFGRGRRARQRLRRLSDRLDRVYDVTDALVELQAREHAKRVAALPAGTPLSECEFRIYSQFGEDGILQHLTAHVPFAEKSFVEFGVEDFQEANCRLLLRLAPWRALILDGRPDLDEVLDADPLKFWRNLTARSTFITAENINQLLTENGFTGDLGILSIDVDGNDYWIWHAVEVAEPRIVIIEYNSIFGPDAAVTVPYKPDFVRGQAHPSMLYCGASLAAQCHLAESRGYVLVGSNSAGNNAFFVRKDVLGDLRPMTAAEAWVESSFRESRDSKGRLTWVTGLDRLELIAKEDLVDVRTGETLKVGDLLK
ncbi:MAG: hypothetical protein ACI8TQ_001306 [Planctomycetota bacterium]|jgi:hypothetical protein